MREPKIVTSTELTTDVIHLFGGLRAGTERNGHLYVYPTGDNSAVEFPVTDKRLYRNTFLALGIDMIGHETISIRNGLQHSTWHLLDLNRRSLDVLSDALDQWSCLANTALFNGNSELGELAKHVSFSLRTSSFRLRDISRAYGFQNMCAVSEGIKEGRRFSNVETFDLFMALHSFLTEVCSARDYLARFISKYILPGTNCVTMAALHKKILKDHLSHPIAKFVSRVCDRQSVDGWMARLSHFRNQIVHVEPMRNISQSKFLLVKRAMEQSPFAIVSLGVPKDPINVVEGDYVDALTHFRNLMIEMLEFARSVASHSPVPAEIPQIREQDLR
jgi:hypothetical protein